MPRSESGSETSGTGTPPDGQKGEAGVATGRGNLLWGPRYVKMVELTQASLRKAFARIAQSMKDHPDDWWKR